MCVYLKFEHKKATQMLNFFAIKDGGFINRMKAIKLTYFSDKYHLRKYGRPITNDEYFAMNYGPVASAVKDISEMSIFLNPVESEYASQYLMMKDELNLKSVRSRETNIFSESDLEACEFAWKNFGMKNEFQLADLSHKYPEWKKHAEELKHYSRIRMSLEDFFGDPDEDVNVCFQLSENEKQERIEQLREYSKIELLWG